MQVIGFNFTKISAERFPEFEGESIVGTNIDFATVKKEKLPVLKESEAYNVSFNFTIRYEEKQEEKKKELKKLGELIFQGNMIISLDKDEPREVSKSFRKEKVPDSFKEPLLNLVLKKCVIKAFDLEDQLGLPSHMPFPYLKIQKNE